MYIKIRSRVRGGGLRKKFELWGMFMKKIAIILVFALVLSLAGCGGSKPKDVSDGVYNAGIEVINICDQYLDALINADKACEKISDICNNLDKLDVKQGAETSIKLGMSFVQSSINNIILRDALNLEPDPDSNDKVLETRNKLAKKLNQKTRK